MMKKIFNLFWLRSIEMLLNIILCIFISFGEIEDGPGLVLPSSISWIPFTIIIVLFVLILLECFNDKPLARGAYLLIANITCIVLLTTESLAFTNCACWLLGLVYLPFLIVKYITTTILNRKVKSEVKDSKTLPVAIFSKKQYFVNNLYILGMIFLISLLMVLSILVWKWNVGAVIGLGIGLFILMFSGLVIIAMKIDPFRQMLIKMNRDAIYRDFEDRMNGLLKTNLHPETINYLNIIKSNFLAMVNNEESIVLFESTTYPTFKQYKVEYEIIEPVKYYNAGDFKKAQELIEVFERKYPKNKGFHALKEMIRLQDVNEVKDDIEKEFNINSPMKFANLVHANYLLDYYSKRGNAEKAKYYAEFLLASNSDLEKCNKNARKVLEQFNLK